MYFDPQKKFWQEMLYMRMISTDLTTTYVGSEKPVGLFFPNY